MQLDLDAEQPTVTARIRELDEHIAKLRTDLDKVTGPAGKFKLLKDRSASHAVP